MRFLTKFACSVAFLAATSAQAEVVNIGDTNVALTAINASATTDTAGMVIFDKLIAFSMAGLPTAGAPTPSVSGNVQTRVVDRNNSDTVAISFRLRDIVFENTVDSAITGISLTGYDGFFPADIQPITETTSDGDVVIDLLTEATSDGFEFSTIVGSGSENTFTAIMTSALTFSKLGSATIFANLDGQAVSTTVFGLAAPTTVVPLPASSVLLLAGLGGLAFARRRKAKA